MIVRIPCLGRDGGLGNNLFRYVFGKVIAKSFGVSLEIPNWIGLDIFQVQDEMITDEGPSEDFIDLDGFFQDPQSVGFWRSMLSIRNSRPLELLEGFRPEMWDKYNRTAYGVCAHLRRGDYCAEGSPFTVIPKEAYVEQFKKLGIDPEEVHWLSEKEARPFIMDDLHHFFAMMNCKLLLRANSSFSWWASELGGAKTYSPSFDSSGNIVWTEGNPPLDLMLKRP